MTNNRKIRVAHIGTGTTGREVLKGVLKHPELELVSLWVSSPEKAGMDGGTLAGLASSGVIAVASWIWVSVVTRGVR